MWTLAFAKDAESLYIHVQEVVDKPLTVGYGL